MQLMGFWSIVFELFFLLTVAMFYLKKILFFEDQSASTDVVMKYLLTGQLVLSGLLALTYSYAPNRTNTSDSAVMIGLILYIYGSIVYCSFASRKKRRWFAFIIPIPLFIFSLSIYNLTRVVLAAFNRFTFLNLLSTYFSAVFFPIFVILVFSLRFVKGSPLWKLDRYVTGKSLSLREELMICFTSVFLAISIGLGIRFEDNELVSSMVQLYGFLLAIIVIFTIFNFNGRRYFENETQNLQRVLITTMADLVENRDENTGGHIRRTAKYVEVIAKELKREKKYTDILTDDYVKDMIIAAPLHDIGKIHVPDSILDKPGKLTDEEFEAMKSHTTYGYKILKHVEKQSTEIPYIQIAKQMAKSHHEWMNGRGYPEGLSGDLIPLCAKIMAVADVFDALVSKRCYKDPMPLDKAYDIMHKETGDHFDPEVSAAFFAAKDEIEQIMREE